MCAHDDTVCVFVRTDFMYSRISGMTHYEQGNLLMEDSQEKRIFYFTIPEHLHVEHILTTELDDCWQTNYRTMQSRLGALLAQYKGHIILMTILQMGVQTDLPE